MPAARCRGLPYHHPTAWRQSPRLQFPDRSGRVRPCGGAALRLLEGDAGVVVVLDGVVDLGLEALEQFFHWKKDPHHEARFLDRHLKGEDLHTTLVGIGVPSK